MTCCWSAVAGIRRCTCSVRLVECCATTRRLAASSLASTLAGLSVAGAANGVMDLAGCLREGPQTPRKRHSRNSVSASGDSAAAARRAARRDHGTGSGAVAGARPRDRISSSTCSATRRSRISARAVGAGMRSVEHIKRYTTIGTAHDQGKTSGVIASGITAELLGVGIESVGHHDVPAAVHPGRVRRAGRA